MKSFNSKTLLFLTLFLWVSMNRAFCASAFVEEGEETPAVETKLFELQNIDGKEAKESVEALLAQEERAAASVDLLTVDRPDGKYTYLAVQDTPENMEAIGKTIQSLEEKETSAQNQTVSLMFNDVPLNEILATMARAYDLNIIGGENLTQKINIHLKDIPIDKAFDILLKTAQQTYVKEGNILWIVPQESVAGALVTEVFTLQFISAEKVRGAISHLVTDAGEVKAFTNFGKEEYANCLIITETAENIKAIKEVIDKLDKPVRQVVIEAKFCEVTLDKDDEVGIDWVFQTSLRGASAPTIFPWGSQGEHVFWKEPSIDTTDGEIDTGTLSFQDFTATLKALDTKTTVNIVASPRLSTRDGEEAEIIIGDVVPIPTYERNEATGSIEVTGYEDQSVGIVMRVTPMVNNDKTVTLVVHPEVSEITRFTGPNEERPVISTREITTTFTVGNGKTFVLGGLKKETVSSTYHQLPILGDLFGSVPFIGKVFRYDDDSRETKELLIFITPTIVEE